MSISPNRRGLECRIGKALLTIPVSAIREVVEYDVRPSPTTSHRLVGGIAVRGDGIVVSLRLVPSTANEARARRTKGVLLAVASAASPGPPSSPTTGRSFAQPRDVSWALEVGETVGLIDCQVIPRRENDREESLPPWVCRATTGEARRVTAWIDVDLVLRELGLTLEGASAWSSPRF